jgi:hypothetical protein
MVGGEGHTASEAGLERLSSRLIDRYEVRCAERARRRRERVAADRAQNEQDGTFSVIPDGTVAVTHEDSTTSLLLEWDGGYGQRLVVQGEHEDIERALWEIAVHGPPGGPDFRGQGTQWHRRSDPDTEHSLTIGGEFRLMRLSAEEHLLMFARNDAGLCVLGKGDAEELRRTARARLKTFGGDELHVYVGEERTQLRGLGAVGVLGTLEAFEGSRLLFGHVTGETFGLYYLRGKTRQCVGLYRFDELYRGNLGPALRWASVAVRAPDVLGDEGAGDLDVILGDEDAARDDEDAGDIDALDDAPVARVARQRRARPQRARTAGRKTRPRSRPAAPTPAPPSRRATHRSKLSAAEMDLLARHMTPRKPPVGPGKTMVPKVLVGIGALAGLGLGNLILRGCDLRRLLEDELGLALHCSSKTFGKALAAVAKHTDMVVPHGPKRWLFRFGDLRLVDSALMRWIASVTPKKKDPPEESVPSTAVESIASDLESAVDPAASTERETAPPGTRTGGPARGVDPADHDPPEPAPASEADAGDHAPRLNTDPAYLVELERIVAQEFQRRNTPQRRRQRTSRASVPDAESASRGQPKRKKDARGPPW